MAESTSPRETARQIAEQADGYKAAMDRARERDDALCELAETRKHVASLTADLAQARQEIIRQEALVTILAEGQTRLRGDLAAAEQARDEALAQATRNIMLYTVRGHEAGVKHGARTALLEAVQDASLAFGRNEIQTVPELIDRLITRAGKP